MLKIELCHYRNKLDFTAYSNRKQNITVFISCIFDGLMSLRHMNGIVYTYNVLYI